MGNFLQDALELLVMEHIIAILAPLFQAKPILGSDPELLDDEQELHALRWFPIQQMKNHPEVARIWDELDLGFISK